MTSGSLLPILFVKECGEANGNTDILFQLLDQEGKGKGWKKPGVGDASSDEKPNEEEVIVTRFIGNLRAKVSAAQALADPYNVPPEGAALMEHPAEADPYTNALDDEEKVFNDEELVAALSDALCALPDAVGEEPSETLPYKPPVLNHLQLRTPAQIGKAVRLVFADAAATDDPDEDGLATWLADEFIQAHKNLKLYCRLLFFPQTDLFVGVLTVLHQGGLDVVRAPSLAAGDHFSL